MVQAATLADGAFRLATQDCSFLFVRPRPGVLITSITGRDAGEFGRAPLDLVESEHRHFGLPVDWFIDASRAINATNPVFRAWTEWLQSQPAALRNVHVLSGNDPAHLTFTIAQHLSGQRMRVYNDRTAWESALTQAAPAGASVPGPERLTEPAVDLQRSESRDGITLTVPDCCFRFRRRGANALWTSISGSDTGSAGTAPFAELETLLPDRRIRWFIDLRAATYVEPSVVALWTAWFSAHRDRFTRIDILATSNAIPFFVTLTKHQAALEGLLFVSRDESAFDQAVAGA